MFSFRIEPHFPLYCHPDRSGGNWPSIKGRACAFESKKSILKVALSQISCYHKTTKIFFENSDFTFQLPALLIEIVRIR